MVEYHYSEETLSTYIDHEIPAIEARMIDMHLQSCPRCNKMVHNLASLSETVKQLPRPVADSLLIINISKQLQTTRKITTLPLTSLFTTWGVLSLLAMSMLFMIPAGNKFLRLLSAIYNETAVLLTSLLHFSWRIPSGPINIILGSVFMIGALFAFYGFSRVYLAMDKKELFS